MKLIRKLGCKSNSPIGWCTSSVYGNLWLCLKLRIFYFSLCLACSSISYGQNQIIADSLESIYLSGNYGPHDRLQILADLAKYHPIPEKSLLYSEELLKTALELDSTRYIFTAYKEKGNSLRLKGDLSEGLASYFKGVELAKKENLIQELGLMYIAIANVYSIMGNHSNTILNYKNAIEIMKELKDSLNYAVALENLGDEYNVNMAKPDSALIFFKESGAIFKALDYKTGLAYNLGNIGLAYAQLGEPIIAEKKISEAITLLETLGDYYPICVYLTYMSDIYMERNDWDAALGYALNSLKLAEQYELKDQISAAYLQLSDLYDKKGMPSEAFDYYKQHIVYRDSVKNITAVQQMADMRTKYEVSQKQIEVDLLNQRQKTQQVIVIATAIALFLIGLLAFGLYRRYRYIRKTKQIIERERDRSEKLLLNILPEETAAELKLNGSVEAKKFESVTVLFTDFVGFTHYAENLPPEKLVESIDFYFTRFDEIMEKYGLEKIKTVGDAYMCAGGLPFPSEDHACRMIRAAFEIRDFVINAKNAQQESEARFNIRIGIHTGPVVAGIVGTKKFSYDIWGDTVNVASRMESMSVPGKINISQNTYDFVKSDCKSDYRGEIQVKNHGKIRMYFVDECNL
ncbi:adenylate/guanylate cyclase domain-containing protein [Arenibacter amylolyticus]|uniref:adenylate/guanylate cyclase domain-containing protein n=1 Tax=Arenibacter amylolyticus TaxID=1406873 RepID=UPI000A399946|nr:adenylate/guanylate cyclase domain-containing protein [Arenibacter amylolyticus]